MTHRRSINSSIFHIIGVADTVGVYPPPKAVNRLYMDVIKKRRLGHHPLALFAWYVERNRILPQMIEARSFQLDYPFYASKNYASPLIKL